MEKCPHCNGTRRMRDYFTHLTIDCCYCDDGTDAKVMAKADAAKTLRVNRDPNPKEG